MRNNRPYVQLDPVVIEQARQMDLLTYLRNYEPSNLRRVAGNVYCTAEHDSLKISNGKWYWWSRGFGGVSALDYLIKVKEYSFVEAVQTLTGEVSNWIPPPPAPKKEEPKELLLPKRFKNCDRVIQYLFGRGIDYQLIQDCIAEGIIFESRRSTTTLFLWARTKAESQSMRFLGVRSAARSDRTHRAATSGIRSDFWQESRQTRCICLKPPLIYCPMPPTSNARARTTEKKTCSLCRACISLKRKSRRAKSPLPCPFTCKKIRYIFTESRYANYEI